MITTASRQEKERYIDIGLVDSNGNLDIIEVKKPFDDKILRRTKYRGNSIPTSELSGGIMQAENISSIYQNGEQKVKTTLQENMQVNYHLG